MICFKMKCIKIINEGRHGGVEPVVAEVSLERRKEFRHATAL